MTELENQTLRSYLDHVSARKSTPGGGAVAAVMAAEACALMNMVANFSDGDEFAGIVAETSGAIDTLMQAGEDDQAAFKSVMKAYRGEGDMPAALQTAAEVPARIIKTCMSRLDHLEQLASRGNANLVSDVAIAALLFDAAIKSSELNILINIRELESPPDSLKKVLHDLPSASSRLHYIITTVRTGLL
ncbi:MAG: cyclodeaminase/cyclohydrolase family protein [Pseudomonadales bacterium]|nr:cyclodeaminase/cyclohydrolase family protein [Pseudomonadales bacterium]